jgi:ABC-type transport system involved in multi-copper enzyme maturation permease subunit
LPLPLRVDPPPVGDRPLLWKELYQGGGDTLARDFEHGVRTAWPSMLLMLFVVQGMIWAVTYVTYIGEPGFDPIAIFGFFMRLAAVVTAAIWCVGTAFRSADTVSRERERHTLDGLFTLPASQKDLLRAKWLGSVLRGRMASYWLGIIATFGLLSGALHPAAVPLLAVAVAAQVAFWASLGVWLSVYCQTRLRARVLMAFLLMAIFGGGWFYLIMEASSPPVRFDPLYSFSTTSEQILALAADTGMNAIHTWWILSFGWDEDWLRGLFSVRMAAAAAGTSTFALFAGLLWWDACRRFCKERPD